MKFNGVSLFWAFLASSTVSIETATAFVPARLATSTPISIPSPSSATALKKNIVQPPFAATLDHVDQETTSSDDFLRNGPDDNDSDNDFQDYNADLLAFSLKGDARSAEKVLKQMVEACKESSSDANAPGLYNYNILLDAWAKSKEPGACDRSLEILDAMHGLAETEDSNLHPCPRSYTAVITAIVRSGRKNAAELAQKVFDQAIANGVEPDAYMFTSVMQVYANIGDAETTEKILTRMEGFGNVNSAAYNTVIKAWKGSSSPEAAERAELNLERLITMGVADTISFSTVIATYAKRGDAASADKAESLLQRMHDLELEGNENVRPNVQTFNAVLNAWVQAGDPERAGLLLDRMMKLCDEGRFDMCPNVVSFSTVINGWAKSPSRGGVAKSEQLFKSMVEMYEGGNSAARPNLISYVSLINAITRSRDKDCAERAEAVIFQMYKQFKDGNTDVKPNTKLIAMVVDAWQKSGKHNAGERAEALLDWMMELFETDNDATFEPNEFIYSSVISAWSRSHSFGKAVRARRVLENMRKSHEAGVIAAAPTTHCYTSVINSCAYCVDDTVEKEDALKIALATYKESERSQAGKPNHVTYATMITALMHLLPASPKRLAAIESIFKRCCVTGQVDDLVIRRMETSLTASEKSEVFAENLLTPGGLIRKENLPAEWRSNTRS